MKVLDLTGRNARPQFALEAIPAAELLVTLSTFVNPEDRTTVEYGEEWFENINTRLSPKLRSSLERVGTSSCKIWMGLLGLVLADPSARSAGGFLQLLEKTSALDIRLHLLGYHLPAHHGLSPNPDVIRRAAEGDEPAKRELLRDGHYKEHFDLASLENLLALDPAETKEVALDVLTRWYAEIFQPEEEEVSGILERDVEAKRAALGDGSPEQLVLGATGIEFLPEAGINQILLVPQLAMRPWVMIIEADSTRFYCYPVADESLREDISAPPARLVRLHRALGDEKRLRLLRILAESSATLLELADRVGLAKSTVHHHLVQLRSAGLVQVTPGDEWRWSLRRDAIPDASSLLDLYLKPTERARRAKR